MLIVSHIKVTLTDVVNRRLKLARLLSIEGSVGWELSYSEIELVVGRTLEAGE